MPPHGRTPFRGGKGSSWEGGVRVPTFVYWKGMIGPRKSDGLFDLADILPTMLSLAGVRGAELADLFPKTTYIDGVDQASFLVADNGLSARRSRTYTLNQYFAAMRIDEFKGVMTAEIENGAVQKGDWGGFCRPDLHQLRRRHCLQSVHQPAGRRERRHPPHPRRRADHGGVGFYLKELIKYPPQFKIGFMSNNPPVYDLLPKMQELRKKATEEQGVGRPTP